jgi:dipeptidyl aminopeptidase/acylaminoacyl peptidase
MLSSSRSFRVLAIAALFVLPSAAGALDLRADTHLTTTSGSTSKSAATLEEARSAEVLAPHSMAALRSVSSAVVSPDGQRIAYTLSVPRKAGVDEDGGPWAELHVVDRASGASRPYATGKGNVSAVAWTHDGASLAFLAKREGDKGAALYLLALDGGEARRAVGLETAIQAFSLAPDGKRVALVAEEPQDPALKKLRDQGFQQEVYEEEDRFARLWVAELFGQDKPRKLDVEGHVFQVDWSPAAERILITRAPTPLVDDQYMRQRAAIVDAGSGALVASIENPGKIGTVQWSPDGARVALIAAADQHDPHAGRLLVADAQSGRFFDPLPDYAADVQACDWEDADTLLFVANHGCETAFEVVDVGAGRGENLTSIAAPDGLILTSVDLSDDGQVAAFTASTPSHPAEVFTMAHGDSAPRRLSDANPALAGVRLARQEVVRFAARDGLELEGVLLRPLDEVAGQRYPLIVYVHGGPEAHEQNGWQTSYSKPGQIAAARGFAVFHPNYRGSTGRGVEFSKLSQGDPAGLEFDDLVDGVDHLVAAGLVDKAKVGITGGSYGGYATAWGATRLSERFAAGVMFVGISDKISKVGTTDIPNEEFYVHALKRPWDDWHFLLERSPIYHADQSRTPLLILHGKDDPRVNPGQSRELYRHLKLRGQAPVRLVFYPGEGHGNRKACSRLDYNLRMLQWMEHYLQGPGGPPPPSAIDYSEPQDDVDLTDAAKPASSGGGK